MPRGTKLPSPVCDSCGAPLYRLEPGTADDASREILECRAVGCELEGRSQPQEGRHSVGGVGMDGASYTLRRGGEPPNEDNLPRVAKHIRQALPGGYDVVVPIRESGVDLEVKCNHCSGTRGIQVVRAIDSRLARDAAASARAVWREGALDSRWALVLETIAKKTQRYPAGDRCDRVLIIDPEPDLALALLFVKPGRSLREVIEPAEEAISSWFGVAVVSFPHRLSWLSKDQCLAPCTCSVREAS